ncbi:MAG: DUF3530 family protein [Aestuariibacter sp.]
MIRICCLLLFICDVAFAQSGMSETEKLIADVQRTLHPDRFKKVLVGEQETVFFSNNANLPLNKGIMILVSEAGRNGASKISLAPMARYFNDYGWATLLITAPDYQWQMPEEQATQSSSQPQPTDSAPETTNEEIPKSVDQGVPAYDATPVINQTMFDAQEQQFLLLMNAANQEAATFPGFIVVIAHGTSAAFLAKLYSEDQLMAPDAFVAISSNWPVKSLNDQIPNLLARTPAPVMDIYNQWDNDWAKSTAKQRRVVAEKSLKMHFRQREIIGQALNQTQYEYIAKEIYGWLSYMGW